MDFLESIIHLIAYLANVTFETPGDMILSSLSIIENSSTATPVETAQ